MAAHLHDGRGRRRSLFLSFMAAQFVRFIGSSDPVALIGCTVIVMGLVFSFVYDSLESPMVTVFVAIGLMNRRYVQPGQVRVIGSPVRRPPAVHRQRRAEPREMASSRDEPSALVVDGLSAVDARLTTFGRGGAHLSRRLPS